MYPVFTGENIPIQKVATILNKSPEYVRYMIEKNIYPIGTCFYANGNLRMDYYISPYLLWKFTGIELGKEDVKEINFSKATLTVAEASCIMKKNKNFIRNGLRNGKLPFGTAFQLEKSCRYNYYISAHKFWEYTGYVA